MARKRGSIRRRKNGTYRIRVYRGMKNGKREYISATEDTHDAAQARLTKILHDLDTGKYVDSHDITVKEYVNTWIDGKEVTEGTRADYRTRMDNDIYPKFGSRNLASLARWELQAHMRDLAGPPRNLSNRTRQYTYTIFKAALDQARRDGLIRENPMEDVERPSVDRTRQTQDITVFTQDQTEAFLEANQETFWYALFYLLLASGLRPSEALALRHEDVDLDRGVIRVERALSRTKNGGYKIGGLKTPSSRRRVSIPQGVCQALERHSDSLRGYSEIGQWSSDLVFPNKAGNVEDISKIRRKWINACKRADVPKIRLYDARHTHATRLLEAGVSPKAAARRLGHSSTKMFLDVYTHLTKDQEDELADTLEALYG